MVLISQTLNPKPPQNLKISQVTNDSAVLTWDGDKGDIYINGNLNEAEIYSPAQINGLLEDTEYTVQIKNGGGESHAVTFKTKKEIYRVAEDFDKSDWTTESIGAILSKITDKVTDGTRSLLVTIDGVKNKTIVLDCVSPFTHDLSNKMMFKIWIEDVTKIANVTLYFGNESNVWNNYCKFVYLGGGEAGSRLKNGWNYLAIAPSEAVLSAKFDFTKTLKRLRISVMPKSDEKNKVVFDSIVDKIDSTPKIVMTFDDGWRTVYDNVFQVMAKRNLVGTIYAIGQYTDNKANPLSPYFMSVNQFVEMKNAGWHIGNHTWQHNYYATGGYTPESYVDTIIKNREWLSANGLGDGNIVCYPNGEYDQDVIDLLKNKGFKTARAAKIRGNHPEFIDDKFQLLSEAFGYTTTFEQAKQWIDRSLEVGGTLFLQFHSIPVDDTIHGPNDSSVGYQNKYISWSLDKFTQLMDYIVSQGITCMTHEQWQNTLKSKEG